MGAGEFVVLSTFAFAIVVALPIFSISAPNAASASSITSSECGRSKSVDPTRGN